MKTMVVNVSEIEAYRKLGPWRSLLASDYVSKEGEIEEKLRKARAMLQSYQNQVKKLEDDLKREQERVARLVREGKVKT